MTSRLNTRPADIIPVADTLSGFTNAVSYTQLKPARVCASEREGSQCALVLSEPISVLYTKKLKPVVFAINMLPSWMTMSSAPCRWRFVSYASISASCVLPKKLLHRRDAYDKLRVYVAVSAGQGILTTAVSTARQLPRTMCGPLQLRLWLPHLMPHVFLMPR